MIFKVGTIDCKIHGIVHIAPMHMLRVGHSYRHCGLSNDQSCFQDDDFRKNSRVELVSREPDIHKERGGQ